MNSEDIDAISILVLIAGRKQKDELLSVLTESGGHLINTIYGRGTVKASFLSNTLGLVPEENKAVITCVVTNKKADAILDMLNDKFHFDHPNTGIAFTIPVERLSF